MPNRTVLVTTAAALYLLSASPILAGQDLSARAAGPEPVTDGGPPPAPVPPATISRNGEGAVTVRAVRVPEPIKLDGVLDEEIYASTPPMGDFIQQEPREGEPATEKTDVWITFDDRNIYISARCWDSAPERMIANEMRRDSQTIGQNENFAVVFDTFHDKRNSVYFQVNLSGGMRDVAGTDEMNQNGDWNTVWDARTSRFDQGWTLEMVIPFRSLRYEAGTEQIWGVNFRRVVRWKNEWSYLTPMPAFLSGRAMVTVSLGATLVGLEAPGGGKNLEIKPYVISGVRTDHNSTPVVANKGEGDVGFDVKYGVTKGLTLDLTYNTDFAQVEDDAQQVNLTRFNLFFPERRDFFLEGQGIFAFGGVGGMNGNAAAAANSVNANTPVLFFSRRIGLNGGRPVPIVGGGRLTGRIGAFTIGALNIQADDEPATATRSTNFAVLRVKRDLFGRSNVGVLYTRRAETNGGIGVGETLGLDGLYSASTNLNINAYYARTRTPGVVKDQSSHLIKFDFNTDRYGVLVEDLSVGAGFNPMVGFLRRTDISRQFAQLRFSPRPARTHMRAVRQFNYVGNIEYFENGAGQVQMREVDASLNIEFQSSDRLTVRYLDDYELIPEPFDIATGVTVPVGGYDYQSGGITYYLGPQRKFSGQVGYEQGSLYGGTKRTVSFSNGRIEATSQLAIEPSLSMNWVRLPWGDFTSTVSTVRNIYMMTPRMFISALVQYNSSVQTLSTNARFRWEYQPGSELFVVYSDGRDTLQKGIPTLTNRAFVVKINRLFRL